MTEICKMDVKIVYLNSYLKEEVYMIQSEGFISLYDHNKVWKLQQFIYRLKQAFRSRNICFNNTIEKFNFVKCKKDNCVYKNISGSIIIFLVLYVDDILFFENDISPMQSTKIWLYKSFSMKILGEFRRSTHQGDWHRCL